MKDKNLTLSKKKMRSTPMMMIVTKTMVKKQTKKRIQMWEMESVELTMQLITRITV